MGTVTCSVGTPRKVVATSTMLRLIPLATSTADAGIWDAFIVKVETGLAGCTPIAFAKIHH